MATEEQWSNTSFAGFGDLAIERSWIPQIFAAAELIQAGGPQAVEAQRGESLDYSYNVTVREGVAVIPITGPISRYHSWLYYYFRGTSIDQLARDFNTALNDPRVHSILFEVNSPGGEVTGVNELARMIFAARGKKPMTARVGGMCCSAAYWIAAACGDVVIDETAQLGSIGVFASFLDTKKFDQKFGFREFKIISDDSPDKCPDPASPEGEKLIKARLNALCDVFVASVAEFRDVTPEKVRSDFGRGDVRVGEHAVEAGLADRFGSFEETIAALAEAHGPAKGSGYTGALHEEGTGGPVNQALAESAPGYAERAGALGERADTDEDELPTCTEHPDGCPDGEPCGKAGGAEAEVSAHAPVTTQLKEGTTEMSLQTEKPSGAAAASQPTIEQLQAQLAALTAENVQRAEEARAASDRVARLEAEARTGRLNGLAANFAGDKAAKVTLMEKLVTAFGEESDELRAYVADQNAAAEQLRAGGVFAETGSSAATASEKSALGQLNAAAAKIAADEKVTPEKAFMLACERNPALYAKYNDEQG